MALERDQVIVDSAGLRALGRWWPEAFGWVVADERADEYEIRPEKDRLPGLLFGRSPDGETVQNRLHLDFRPDDRDTGRTGDESWVVPAGPEGNEFCAPCSRAA
jgi:hypothetical protein